MGQTMASPQKVAVVTSRRRRLMAVDDVWLLALRGVLRKIKSEASQLVIGEGTAGSDFIRHTARRLGVSLEAISVPANCVVDDQAVPMRDRVVFENAGVVYVLGLRSGGNLHRLLRERLQQRPGSVIFVDIPRLQAISAQNELCELGALTWSPTAEMCVPIERQTTSTADPSDGAIETPNEIYLIVPFPHSDDWDFLTHTTRSCPGPWPNESFESYADSLLESRAEADHSPLGALQRIVRQRRLIASNRTIRGGHAVVSFTSCPLAKLPSLHRFQTHRVRWDFEPFGLCIRRDWLLRRGVRRVTYADESNWKSLDENDRPFFQLAKGDSGIDWSIESEWRHLGDLDLTGLSSDDVLLFVPNFKAAKSLADVAPWPITLWPNPS